MKHVRKAIAVQLRQSEEGCLAEARARLNEALRALEHSAPDPHVAEVATAEAYAALHEAKGYRRGAADVEAKKDQR